MLFGFICVWCEGEIYKEEDVAMQHAVCQKYCSVGVNKISTQNCDTKQRETLLGRQRKQLPQIIYVHAP